MEKMTKEERERRAHLVDTRDSSNVRRSLHTTFQEVRSVGGFLTFDGIASSTSVRDADGTLLRDNGYDMGFYTERIMAGAFTETLAQNPDCSYFVNHTGLALARTTNGSLTLDESSEGLHFVARALEDDATAQDLAMRVNAGLVDQCSFAFRIKERSWDEDRENLDITKVDLNRGDVSAVSYGANPRTPIGVRSLLLGIDELSHSEIEELRQDPDVMRVVRMLAEARAIEENITEPVVDDEPVVSRLSLDLARAHAHALRLKNSRP